jgi:hypothetical protein
MATQIGKLKIGGEKRSKIIAAAVLGAFALFMVVRMLMSVFGGPDAPAPAANTTAQPSASSPSHANTSGTLAKNAAANGSKSLDPTLRFDLLARSENVEYSGAGRNVFSLTAPPPPMPVPIAPIRPLDATPPGPPPPPPKPPINLTFYGYESARGGSKRVFLINPNQDVFIAGEGEIVDKRYKVMKITSNSVDIQDILNDNTQTIRLTTQAG